MELQQQSGHCLIYAIANALNDEFILNYKDRFIPLGHEEANQILPNTSYSEYIIRPLIQTFDAFMQIPIDFALDAISTITKQVDGCDDDIYTPIIFTVMCKGFGASEKNLHAIAVYYRNKEWYFKDPRFPFITKLPDLKDLLEHFEYIQAIHYFCTKNNGSLMSIMNDEDMFLKFKQAKR